MFSRAPSPQRVTPFDDPRARFLAGTFGVQLFLVSLAMLFAASLVGFLVIRMRTATDWPQDFPALPRILWVSTIVLAVSSATMQWAVVAARAGRAPALRTAMVLTVSLGLAFLAAQTAAGSSWVAVVAPRWTESEAYRFALSSFYVLTGLHALHVVGGLIPMTLVTRGAFANRYGPDRFSGVQYCAMYWHFLGVVWLVLLAALVVGV